MKQNRRFSYRSGLLSYEQGACYRRASAEEDSTEKHLLSKHFDICEQLTLAQIAHELLQCRNDEVCC
jgi:hypothetical protein